MATILTIVFVVSTIVLFCWGIAEDDETFLLLAFFCLILALLVVSVDSGQDPDQEVLYLLNQEYESLVFEGTNGDLLSINYSDSRDRVGYFKDDVGIDLHDILKMNPNKEFLIVLSNDQVWLYPTTTE